MVTLDDILTYHKRKLVSYHKRLHDLNTTLVGMFSEGARQNKIDRAKNRIAFHQGCINLISQVEFKHDK